MKKQFSELTEEQNNKTRHRQSDKAKYFVIINRNTLVVIWRHQRLSKKVLERGEKSPKTTKQMEEQFS